MVGCRGNSAHREIADAVEHNLSLTVNAAMAHRGYIGLIFVTGNDDGDSEMARIMGSSGHGRSMRGGAIRDGCNYPDCVWEWLPDGGAPGDGFAIAIEIGQVDMKHLPPYPILHISFDRRVNILNMPNIYQREIWVMAEELERALLTPGADYLYTDCWTGEPIPRPENKGITP